MKWLLKLMSQPSSIAGYGLLVSAFKTYTDTGSKTAAIAQAVTGLGAILVPEKAAANKVQ